MGSGNFGEIKGNAVSVLKEIKNEYTDITGFIELCLLLFPSPSNMVIWGLNEMYALPSVII